MSRPPLAPRSPRLLILLAALGLLGATGGPDGSGIVFTDSAEVDGPPHGVLDLSGTDSLGLSGDGQVTTALPFDFSWYGATVSSATISNNGTLFFGGASSAVVTTCPGGAGTWSGIAAFADDLGVGTVRAGTLGRYPHRVFAVEWQSPHATAGGSGTVQAWLLEGGGRRQEAVVVLEDITFGSAAVDGGASAVVGVQPGDGSDGVAWSCSGGLSDGSSAWFGPEGGRPASSQRLDDTLESLWYGVDTRGYLGQSLALGDVNGDGLADILAGQPQDDLAYLIYGSPEDPGDSIDVAGAVALSWGGSGSPDLATALQLADLDGDGLADLLLGTPQDDTATTNAGAIYGVAGGSGLAASISLPGDADLALAGPSKVGDARAGYALTTADLDGDGYRDLVVGAPYADTNAVQAGAVYLWYGHLSALDGTIDDLDAAPVLNGEDTSDWAGFSVAAADLDGDGLAEILVGAPNVDDAASNAGAAYLVAGSLSAASSRDLHTDSHLLVLGDSSDDKAGSAVALGDVDGDGLGDLILGAPSADDGATNAGVAYVLYGPTSLSSGTYGVSSADVEILSTVSNASFGQVVRAVDLDADGVDDLLVGAPNELSGTSGGGVVRRFDASSAGALSDSDAVSEIVGSTSAGQLGTALAAGLDASGDGYPDVVMAAPYADYGLTGAGRIYLWSTQPDFEDLDGDGFVTTASGGIDCDDDDASVYPGASEDSANGIDDDCDGWIDDALSFRRRDDWLAYDLASVLGSSTLEPDLFDFEDTTSGDLLDTHYSELGVSFSADGYVTAATEVWGTVVRGTLGARVTASSSENTLTLLFADEVDALTFYALDVQEGLEASASRAGTLLVSGAVLPLAGDDRTGGVYVGVLFAEPVDEVILTGPLADAWGLDDLGVYWASRSDRDGDGYSDDGGDCDDADAAVYPGATEDLSNGKDDDCDGAVDGGSVGVYDDDGDWSAAAGLREQVIDFEDLTEGDTVTDDYADLGLTVSDGALEVSAEVDGAAPRDLLAGETGGSLTLTFDEVQPGVGLWLLDLDDTLSFEGYVDGTLLYSDSVDGAGDDLDGGVFLGLVFDYGVDTLILSSDAAVDTWGLDDVVISQLGLDDADGDGFTEADGDCDDSDPDAAPGAEETWYDGVDGDCDGKSDYDEDGDGYDSATYGGIDCDDGDSATSPDAEETWYDGVDSDCSGGSDYDSDYDGYDFYPDAPDESPDCDDGDGTTNPDAEETWYDGVDSDCDGASDYDSDGDGYAASGSGGLALLGDGDCDDTSAEIGPDAEETWYDGVDADCDEASDYDADGDGYDAELYGGTDCHDNNPAAYPGASGEVWYDGVDQDCDDESDYDADGDGYDREGMGLGGDCDDTDPAINPDASDTIGDGIDSNCDDAPEFDDDGDGYDGEEDGGRDCDDTDATISPDAAEVWYDGIDQDCNGKSDYDADRDGYDSDLYGGADCDDADATVNPSATDYYYDGIDNDCDGKSDFDADGDGYPATWYGGTDCDDGDASVYPGALDYPYDGINSDCSGGSDYDADGDGYDSDLYGGRDCDDTTADVGPYIAEIPLDGVDQNCDGLDDVDVDRDGWTSAEDCDDGDADIHPEATDLCYDGVDSDCDAFDDNDCDTDGHVAAAYGGDDCDDLDDAIYPGAAEVWYDTIDQDCDGGDDFDADRDGHRPLIWGGGDCDDASDQTHPGIEADGCGDGDNDCDGETDEDCGTDADDTGTPAGDDTGPAGDDTGGSSGPGDDTGGGSGSGGEETGWTDPNADWVPPAGSTAGEVVGGKGSRGCSALGAVGGGGWLALLGLWGRRRRRP